MRDNKKLVDDGSGKKYLIFEEDELEFARLVAIQDHKELEIKFGKYLTGKMPKRR